MENILPQGWHVFSHPITGEPVALIDPSGKLQVLTDSKSEMTPSFCKECGLKVKSSTELKGHMEREHPKEVFACRLCENEYENENYLNMHYEKCPNQTRTLNYDF